jgi:hypothetical protein
LGDKKGRGGCGKLKHAGKNKFATCCTDQLSLTEGRPPAYPKQRVRAIFVAAAHHVSRCELVEKCGRVRIIARKDAHTYTDGRRVLCYSFDLLRAHTSTSHTTERLHGDRTDKRTCRAACEQLHAHVQQSLPMRCAQPKHRGPEWWEVCVFLCRAHRPPHLVRLDMR